MYAELTTLVRLLTRWTIVLFVVTIGFVTISVQPVDWYGVTLWQPAFEGTALAALMFIHLATVLTPPGVELVVLSPMAAFAAQIWIAFWLAVLVTLPFLFISVYRYLAPALLQTERRALVLVGCSLIGLLLLGVAFSYTLLSPYTIYILYTFTAAIGVTPLLGVSELIATFMALTLTTAILFTVPVGMVLLTWVGLLSSTWWREHARYAIVGFLCLSAIITPDGTGVSMLLLSVPVTVLYSLGMIVSTRVDRRHL